MSKIKDLLAEVEGIDDLMPPREPSLKELAERVAATVDYNQVVDELRSGAEFSHGYDDEGHPETYFENYLELCDGITECALDLYIQEQHVDLSDEQYAKVLRTASDIVADNYADLESEIIDEAIQNAKDEDELRQDYYNAVYDRSKHE